MTKYWLVHITYAIMASPATMWCAGLGTSSILGACVLATLYRISGLNYDLDTLVHAVSVAWGMVYL